MSTKYSGIDNINKPAFDAIASKVKTLSTKLYRHHFDIVLNETDFPLIPSGTIVSINVNAISTNPNKWTKFGELDGDGFIVSAFGGDATNIFELKLLYKALEKVFIEIHQISNMSDLPIVISTVGGGQTPSTFPLQDSVTPL